LNQFDHSRRVPGLRRSEVADLAGVSVEYDAHLERGNVAGLSEGVLDALARACSRGSRPLGSVACNGGTATSVIPISSPW
jgi:transcriptional regulator with XRE-family HTH domain